MHFWTIWILTGKEGKVSADRADVAGADEDGGGGDFMSFYTPITRLILDC